MQPLSLRRPSVRTIGILALGSILLFQAPWSATAAGNGTPATVAVNCEPNQQAVVRQTIVNGETHVNIQCVSAAHLQQPVMYTDQYGRPLQMLPTGAVGPSPVSYTSQPAYAPAPVYAQPVYAPAPAVRTRTVTQRRVVSERPVDNRRSWQKTALLIGGSAGTGAGVGGLVGGKKGALIGAAIGGGTASIYESAKR